MQKPMRELRKCLGCPKYFWTVSQSTEAGTDTWSERLKYCSDCWNTRIQKPVTLRELERENTELSEEEKQAEEQREIMRRWRGN